jgi:trk system potassium uptake protein TrkA
MLDFIQFEPDYAMVKTEPPEMLLGRPLSQTGVRRAHGITVVGVKTARAPWSHATGDTVLKPGDTVIISGQPRAVERFSNLR